MTGILCKSRFLAFTLKRWAEDFIFSLEKTAGNDSPCVCGWEALSASLRGKNAAPGRVDGTVFFEEDFSPQVRHLRERFPSLKSVFLCPSGGEDAAYAALARGATAVLPEPLDETLFREVMFLVGNGNEAMSFLKGEAG